jgi:hypothetical protein
MQCIKPTPRTASEASEEMRDGTPRSKSVAAALLEMRKNAYPGGKRVKRKRNTTKGRSGNKRT